MQVARAGPARAEINVTPLVDVVLVLLIIFMVVTPMLDPGPAVKVPTTHNPPNKPQSGEQIVVFIESDGTIWLGEERMTAGQFTGRIAEAAQRYAQSRVVVRGDASLPFGEVKRVMLAVNDAGFKGVSLITEKQTEP